MGNNLQQPYNNAMRWLGVTYNFTQLSEFWWSTSKFQAEKVQQNITVAQSVYKQYLKSKESLLLTAAKVLTADFGFKQAVATRDAATISSVLYNHSQRINADLMLLLDLSGRLVSANVNAQNFADNLQPLMDELLNNSEQSSFVVLNNQLYQVILLPVKTPRTIAYSLVGFKITSAVTTELKSLTGMEVSFVAQLDSFAASSFAPQPEKFQPIEYFENKTTARFLLSTWPMKINK